MQGSADKIIHCMISALLLSWAFWPLLIHFEERWLYNWCRSWNSWLPGLWWDYDPRVVSEGLEGFWPRPCGTDSCAKVWCKSCYITGFMRRKKKRSPDLCQRRLTSFYSWLFCFVLFYLTDSIVHTLQSSWGIAVVLHFRGSLMMLLFAPLNHDHRRAASWFMVQCGEVAATF